MHSPKAEISTKPDKPLRPEDRRRSRRRQLNRVAKVQVAAGTLPRDCLITDISDGGVRLHVEGYDVPDDFVLLLDGDAGVDTERAYRVVWRLGYEIGARLVGILRRKRQIARG